MTIMAVGEGGCFSIKLLPNMLFPARVFLSPCRSKMDKGKNETKRKKKKFKRKERIHITVENIFKRQCCRLRVAKYERIEC
jgi:hypothetical protein